LGANRAKRYFNKSLTTKDITALENNLPKKMRGLYDREGVISAWAKIYTN